MNFQSHDYEHKNGQRLSTVDWRANRLVDALAKLDAALRELPAACVKLLDSAECAVKHSAKLLARVTHAANNHTLNCRLGETILATPRNIIIDLYINYKYWPVHTQPRFSALYGRWDALDACKILPRGVGTICPHV